MSFIIITIPLSINVSISMDTEFECDRHEAHLFAIRITPSARVTVTQIGNPSGMAATAKDTPMLNISISFLLCD